MRLPGQKKFDDILSRFDKKNVSVNTQTNRRTERQSATRAYYRAMNSVTR